MILAGGGFSGQADNGIPRGHLVAPSRLGRDAFVAGSTR